MPIRMPILLFSLLVSLLLAGCEVGDQLVVSVSVAPSATETEDDADNGGVGESAQIRFASTLYAGPGAIYETAGNGFPGQDIRVVGRDETGEWFQLSSGEWIVDLAVDLEPDAFFTLPVITSVTGRIVATVTDVRDGDTIEVSVAGERFPVRMIMVIAPLPNQPLGQLMIRQNEQMMLGEQVLLEADVEETDPYGRAMRYVYLPREDGDILINELVIESGLGQLALFEPNLRYAEQLIQAQSTAQQNGVGIWGREAPIFYADDDECLYSLQPGESLLGLARRFGISLLDLADANELDNPNLIRDGTELTIPGCRGG